MVKKIKKKKTAWFDPHSNKFIIAAVVIIGFIFIIFMVNVSRSRVKQPVFNTETSKTIVRTLPPEVKKQVAIASISAEIRVPILMYHYVEYVQDKRDTIRESLNINPFIFDAQIQTLKTAGYTFMTARELGEVLDGKLSLPQKPVLLTFDDGHWDFYTDVLPILKKYNVKATQYVIPGFTGGSDFMTQKEVQAIVDSGLVDVGAHTVHHVSLKGHLLANVKFEVEESKKLLEDTYHIKVVSFAYPNGSFDLQAEQVVKDSGFTTSVSTVPGIEQSKTNRFFLYRLRPGRRTGAELLNWLKQDTFRAF